jgi:hypothetical protein
MLPPDADRPKLAATLDHLSGAVEELLLSGLTTASESTRQTVAAAMQEAARFRLLRLGSTLRGAAEELGRFIRHEPAFSRRRLTFFLNRAWLLARGLAHAIRSADAAGYDRLNWSPPTRPLPEVEVVCLGAVKKVAAGSFVAFDFRLRATTDAEPVTAGQRLSWSVVFPIRPGAQIPPEGYLHLPQKQKFSPNTFLDRKTVVIRDAALAVDESGAGRISLADASTVTAGAPFADWPRLLDWSTRPALDRLAQHRPGPLDLETELQEEVVLRDYTIGPPADGDEPGQSAYPVAAGPLSFYAVVGPDVEGKALRKALDDLRKPKADRPPLFGLLHYEKCRLVLQPLATFGDAGPAYLTISKENIDKAALLRAMKFT